MSIVNITVLYVHTQQKLVSLCLPSLSYLEKIASSHGHYNMIREEMKLDMRVRRISP